MCFLYLVFWGGVGTLLTDVFYSLIGLNSYLTLNTSGSGTILIDLSPEDKEFQSVEEEVLLYSHPHPPKKSVLAASLTPFL